MIDLIIECKGGTCDVDNIVGGYHPTGYCHLPESLFELTRKTIAANQREQS